MPKKKVKGEYGLGRISRGLLERVERYLETPQAKSEGNDSVKDVMDEAVKQFLRSRGLLR